MHLQKYIRVAQNTWAEILTYRLNFSMWRIRNVLGLVMNYYLWLVIIPTGKSFLGYSQSLMLTYILGASFLSSIVLSSRSNGVGDEINRGDLSNFLVRPVNYFYYLFARDTGDKAMNISFSIVELAILFFILRPPIFFQTNIALLILTLLSVMIGLILYFCFNLLIGFVGFWSSEVWAPRFIFSILLGFLAGSSFPLDILPKEIYLVFKLLPFTYLQYFPIKIYLGQVSSSDIAIGLLISLFWIIIMAALIKIVWRRGLKVYTSYGR